MDMWRIILYAALTLVVYSLWVNWQHDYPAPIKAPPTNMQTSKTNGLLPTIEDSSSTQLPSYKEMDQEKQQTQAVSKVIQVKTDVFNIKINLDQGDIIEAQLLQYPVSIQDPTPITLIHSQINQSYTANSSLLESRGDKVNNISFNFNTLQPQYVLEPGSNNLTITLNGSTPTGLMVKKVFVFTRGSYLIQVIYQINNQGTTDWKGYMNTQLLRSSPVEDKFSLFHVGSYTGASYSNPSESRYKKISFTDMAKSDLNSNVKGGWIAMQQHYFLSAWIPDALSNNLFYTRSFNANYSIGIVSQAITVEPGTSKTVSSKLYIGPEITSILKSIAPGLDLTVDYGWLWFLSSLLFSFLKTIYTVVGNWGVAIILVTILIKLAFYRLSASSYKSMAGIRKLQPKLQALRERYGDDKAKMSQATMELYKQEKVNPLGGCLPIVIQIPVFIALYWVLLESVELRQAPFVFWVHDLSAADPYHILPIIMGITMLIQQRLNPAPPDPIQAKLMMLLPVLFTALFWNFPAGLVLYWIVNNTLSILQQWYISRKYGA